MLMRRAARLSRLDQLVARAGSNTARRHGFRSYAPTLQEPQDTSERKPHPRATARLEDAVTILKNTLEQPSTEPISWDAIPTSYTSQEITLVGYLGQRVDLSKGLFFIPFFEGGYPSKAEKNIQIVSASPILGGGSTIHEQLKSIEANSLVRLEATIRPRMAKPKHSVEDNSGEITELELVPHRVSCLSRFPKETIYTKDTEFSPERRHLQLRSRPEVRRALEFRSVVSANLRDALSEHQFQEVETPILFKPTPEGAREFLVPTRHEGHAYALAQSPQQLKQMLMAGTITRYFQFAKCFRDEDLRADRQPEFTQLDLEMNLANGTPSVMDVVEDVLRQAWNKVMMQPQRLPFSLSIPDEAFPRITYDEAMTRYGSDKPDVRLGMEIMPITDTVSSELKRMVSQLDDPVIELYKLHVSDSANDSMEFVRKFMDSPTAKPFQENPDGAPGIFTFDSRKPLHGLSAFGFEGAEQVSEALCLDEGDVVVIQARKNEPFYGPNTALGNLRIALHRTAVTQGLIPKPQGFEFLWVTQFPMFSPIDEDPGQGGAAGIKATHHPFTAPASAADLDLLFTDPLKAKADHYDLVVNGVELGGGSRRIHVADIQEYVFRDVLKMPEDRIADFAHLTRALRDGCPPHGGFAFGFDRLVAVMLGKDSIRDVMAFPKSGKGEDLMAKAPSVVSDEVWKTYHLRKR